MCLILFAFQLHPGYQLILAANRDEYYTRATAPSAWWDDAPWLLAGKDLEAGGTWLGITKNGKIAALTNYRGKEHKQDAPSRGLLVSRFLTSNLSIDKYSDELGFTGSRYNGFNLIFGDIRKDNGILYYFSNVKGKGEIERLKPGLYGLSNDTLDTPWPKIVKGKKWLEQQVLNRQGSLEIETVFSILADDTIPPDDQLPDTGIGIEKERALSSLFIKTPVYGTRSSTVLSVDNNYQVTFVERNFVSPVDTVEKRYGFKVQEVREARDGGCK